MADKYILFWTEVEDTILPKLMEQEVADNSIIVDLEVGEDAEGRKILRVMVETDDWEDWEGDGTLGPCGCVDYHMADCSVIWDLRYPDLHY